MGCFQPLAVINKATMNIVEHVFSLHIEASSGYMLRSGFWQDGHFYYSNPANPRAWENIPSSEIFAFFLQRLEVFVVQIFHLLA
jgi:cysteine synthase